MRPGYKVDQRLEILFSEYLVTGPNVNEPRQGGALVCTYSTRPVVMVYVRELNGHNVGLIRKLDEAVGKHKKERLGSYVVLICQSRDREKELLALAEKEKIQNVLLSLAVLDDARMKQFESRFGAEAQTTVILATSQRRVKSSYAFRKSELKERDADRILSDLPGVFPR